MRHSASAKLAHGGKAHKMMRPALVAILLSAAMVSDPFLTQAVAQSYSFSNVVVEGNERIEPATILKYAGIGKGESVTAGALNDAYQRIVQAGLFETVELVPNGNTLIIRVKEFPMMNVVDFQGNKRLKDEVLTKIVKSKSRLVYSPAQAEADAGEKKTQQHYLPPLAVEGSRASRRPSPRRLNERVVTRRAVPGTMTIHQATR